MQLITDGLLLAAALFAGTYCWVLGRRVRALQNLDAGLGGAITQMTRALEDARRALEEAKTANRDGRQDLKDLATRAEAAAGHLRILLAATKDLTPADVARVRPAREVREPAAEARVDAADGERGASAPEGVEPVTPPRDEREPEAGREVEDAGLPKPRKLFPLEALRPRARPAPAPEAPRSEDDLMVALSAFAAPAQS